MPEQQRTTVLDEGTDFAIPDWNERAQRCKKNQFRGTASASLALSGHNNRNQSLSAVAGPVQATRIFETYRKESDYANYADGALQSMQLTRQWHHDEDVVPEIVDD